MKKVIWLTLTASMLLMATPLLAEGGCVNSPEAPTFALALMGGAGALASLWRRSRR